MRHGNTVTVMPWLLGVLSNEKVNVYCKRWKCYDYFCVLQVAVRMCPAPFKMCPAPSKMCPAPSKMCPAPFKMCPAPFKMCPAPSKMCPALAQMRPEIAKMRPKIAKMRPVPSKMCPAPSKMCTELPKMCTELPKMCPELPKMCPELTTMCPEVAKQLAAAQTALRRSVRLPVVFPAELRTIQDDPAANTYPLLATQHNACYVLPPKRGCARKLGAMRVMLPCVWLAQGIVIWSTTRDFSYFLLFFACFHFAYCSLSDFTSLIDLCMFSFFLFRSVVCA